MSTTHAVEAATATRSADGFRTRPLAPAIGAEIIGVDLSRPMSDDLFAKVLDTWHQNLVILFRDQDLTEDEQVRFGERFGPPAVSHTRRYTTTNPAVMLISNIRENGQLIGALPDGEMHFHTDQCHQERPAMASMLYSLEVPSRGGNTLFANAYLAYETLSEPMKQQLEGRKALNAYDYDNASMLRGTQLRDGIPSSWHPIVRTHPATGRKALYVNRLMTVAIEGLAETEGNALLDALFDHQEQPQFIYEHVWRPHDVLLWDNRCTLHARTDFRAAERRLMRRLTILGEKPF
ncbi:MAG TPA: TauD/TfdA family dioxygenase [Xanthobacteraceae bacterium]|jgi:taurine dioxygenase|nr:TauD/TfdA family dioxygenase [Xanthobacteraceae bacterium]